MLKKFISVFGVLGVSVFCMPLVAFGYVSCRDTDKGCTIEQLLELSKTAPVDKSEKIAILQELITKLVAQLAVLKQLSTPAPISAAAGCLDLSVNLIPGTNDATTGGAVSRLQLFLRDAGVYPGGQITGYYGPLTAEAVTRWQKANGMDFVTTKSGVGQMTREKMRCKAAGMTSVRRIAWHVDPPPRTAPFDDFESAKQTISIDITTASGTERYALGTAYGCDAGDVSDTVTARGKNVLGRVQCYYALTGTTFTMYSDTTLIDANMGKYSVRYWVERFDDDASGRTAGKTTTVLELP